MFLLKLFFDFDLKDLKISIFKSPSYFHSIIMSILYTSKIANISFQY